MSAISETQSYAFFDVDGTVIAKDSFRILMRTLLLQKPSWRLALAAVLFCFLAVLRIFGQADKTQFKSALLWCATVGRGKRESLALIRKIIHENITPLWFREMEHELQQLRAAGHTICYVSASGEPWLRFLLNRCDSGRKRIVGSKLMSFCGGLTLRGPNCLGPEKIVRLRKILPAHVVWAVGYSDHRADLPLLLACKRRVVVNPSAKNLKAFRRVLGESHFEVVQWTPTNGVNTSES